jgi:hypothetical protein
MLAFLVALLSLTLTFAADSSSCTQFDSFMGAKYDLTDLQRYSFILTYTSYTIKHDVS